MGATLSRVVLSHPPFKSQPGRAHLLLVSWTPGLASGGTGGITLKGTCHAPMVSRIILSLSHDTR